MRYLLIILILFSCSQKAQVANKKEQKNKKHTITRLDKHMIGTCLMMWIFISYAITEIANDD